MGYVHAHQVSLGWCLVSDTGLGGSKVCALVQHQDQTYYTKGPCLLVHIPN